MTETDGPGLPMRPEEFELLAHRWARLPEGEKAYFTDNMSRAQRRRFERTLAEVEDGKKDFAGKLTTREDVVQMIALFMERHVMGVAADVDLMAKDLIEIKRWYDYQRLPWWRKARVTLNVWWALVVRWLEAKGITFTKVETDGQEGTEAEAVLANEPAGGSASGDAAAARESSAEGARPADSLIEVVAR